MGVEVGGGVLQAERSWMGEEISVDGGGEYLRLNAKSIIYNNSKWSITLKRKTQGQRSCPEWRWGEGDMAGVIFSGAKSLAG